MKDFHEQKITRTLALTQLFLKKIGAGVCRVHGGGFAGVIAAIIPEKEQENYVEYISKFVGKDNVTTSLPFIMTPVAVNMDKTKRWLERQVMPSLLMIKEIEKQTGANYLEEIDRHTRLTEKQELKIKQMTTDIADMIEKDTAVPQGNDGIF